MTQPRRTARLESRSRQRGSVLAMTGIAMVMIVAMAVIGVDLGHLALTANEVQTLADLSATSYIKTVAANIDDGGSRNPVTETAAVIAQNSVASGAASLANIQSFEEGNFDTQTRVFQPGGMPVNAVRATAVATVSNFFAGMFGRPQSTVTREATAALVPPGNAPVLPLAIGECHFDIFENDGDCTQQVHLDQVPNPSENTCFTSLLDGSANSQTIVNVIERYCGIASGAPSRVSVGDQIIPTNPSATPILRAVQECVRRGVTEFVVPVIPCRDGRTECSPNEHDTVRSFGTIRISSPTQVITNGPDSGIYPDAVCNTSPPGATGQGGASTGTEIVGLVR